MGHLNSYTGSIVNRGLTPIIPTPIIPPLEKLLGKIGDGQGDDDAEHPLQFVEFGIVLNELALNTINVCTSRQRAIHHLRKNIALRIDERLRLHGRNARGFKLLDELQGIEGNRAHCSVRSFIATRSSIAESRRWRDGAWTKNPRRSGGWCFRGQTN